MQEQHGRGFGESKAVTEERQRDGAEPGKHTLVGHEYPRNGSAPLRRREAPTTGAAMEGHEIHAAAARGLEGAGGAFPHRATIQQLFGQHDVSSVKAQAEGPAETACRDIGGQAYASGTSAAAAVHPVAQRQQGSHGASPVAQRDTKHAAPAPTSAQQEASRVERLIELLNGSAAPTDDAFAYLNGMSLADMLTTISGAADRGYLARLIARSSGANAYDRARIMSALHAVELARAAPSSVTTEQLNACGVHLEQISRDEQLQVFEYILHRRGLSLSVTTLMEGVVAMREHGARAGGSSSGGRSSGRAGDGAHGTATDGAAPASGGTAATTVAPSPVEPGPWAPPGEQPIPLYVGNEAHKSIATEYKASHAGESVLSNSLPVSTILDSLTSLGHTTNAGGLKEAERVLVPDIVNLTRLHLYEIKPLAAQPLGTAKATMYLGLFRRAGTAMTLGPTGEPGTSGGVPAPGGVFMFWAPEPGVIVYQYRRGRLVPVPVPEPEPVTVRRWRFELQPLTPQQQSAVTTTTLGAAMVFVVMLLLSPAGI